MAVESESDVKFAFNTQPVSQSTSSKQSGGLVSLCAAQEKLLDSYMGLTESCRHLDEVTAVMDNIQTSIEMLKVHSNAAIPLLNFDAGLESLMGIPEKLITAEKAIEDLEKRIVVSGASSLMALKLFSSGLKISL